jgi:monoamine oxidase
MTLPSSPSLSRRGLLAVSLAALLPGVARAALPREAEIVVIGAGAAGIAAARRIAAAGRKVLLLEAGDRVGGRCQTDTGSFGQPVDRGARWIYNSDIHPLAKVARSAGVEIINGPQGQKIRIGRRNARAGEAEEFLAAMVRANRAIDEGGRRGDIACAPLLPKDLGDWAGAIDFLLGPAATGRDLRELSALDQSRAERRDAPAAPRGGLGSLMGKLAEGLPLSLNTPATRVVWSGNTASIETPAGTVAARAVVLTCSPDVLLSGRIKFSPDLPKRVVDAAAKLTLGSYDRIVLELAGNPLGLARDDVLVEQSRDVRTALLQANVGGGALCLLDVGGGFGRELSGRGEAAMIAFATEWLTKLFGNDIAAAVKKSAATRWNASPWILGGMSAALPGGHAGRRVLMEPLGPLFLAGDAAHETAYGTVGGAWQSGERAAEAALKRIGALKDPAPQSEKPARPRKRAPAPSGAGAPGMAWPRT